MTTLNSLYSAGVFTLYSAGVFTAMINSISESALSQNYHLTTRYSTYSKIVFFINGNNNNGKYK